MFFFTSIFCVSQYSAGDQIWLVRADGLRPEVCAVRWPVIGWFPDAGGSSNVRRPALGQPMTGHGTTTSLRSQHSRAEPSRSYLILSYLTLDVASLTSLCPLYCHRLEPIPYRIIRLIVRSQNLEGSRSQVLKLSCRFEILQEACWDWINHIIN